MENKFKKGMILGGLLTAAAAIGYAMSKEGRQMTRDIKEDLRPFARNLKMRFHRIQDVTKEEFNDLVTNIVEEFARRKDISNISKSRLINTLKMKWDNMQKEDDKDVRKKDDDCC